MPLHRILRLSTSRRRRRRRFEGLWHDDPDMSVRELGKGYVMIDVRTTPPYDVCTAIFCDHLLGVLGWLYPVG